MELWDAYDEHGNKIEGMILKREDPIPAGIYHLGVSVTVRHTDGTFLITQREPTKNCGGMWEATSGGSAILGEDALAGAKRELFEETGLQGGEWTEMGRGIVRDSQHLYVDFLCVLDCEKDSIRLQPRETVAYRWVTKEELLSFPEEEMCTEHLAKYYGN